MVFYTLAHLWKELFAVSEGIRGHREAPIGKLTRYSEPVNGSQSFDDGKKYVMQ